MVRHFFVIYGRLTPFSTLAIDMKSYKRKEKWSGMKFISDGICRIATHLGTFEHLQNTILAQDVSHIFEADGFFCRIL